MRGFSAARWRALALALILAVELLLRLAGLSHDLEVGQVYHPDTRKQVAAAQNYLHVLHHFRLDHPDYDGYPYLSSRLAAGGARSVIPCCRTCWWSPATGITAAMDSSRPVICLITELRCMSALSVHPKTCKGTHPRSIGHWPRFRSDR
jgi:hypothetical protein